MHNLEKVIIAGIDGKDVECGHLTCDETCTLRLNDVLTASQDYMFQIKIKSKKAATLSVLLGGSKTNFDIASEWDKKVEKFSSVDVTNKYMDLMFTSGEYWFYNAKLEIGAVLTDWSLGEGDVTERIVEAESRITQKINEVELRVEDSEKNISSVDIKVDEVKTEVVNARGEKATLSVRIDALESSVTDANGNASNALQTANGFDQRVTNVEGNITSLQQKAESIEMSVSNINIGGRNYILNSRFMDLDNTDYITFEDETAMFGDTLNATNDSDCEVILDCVQNILYDKTKKMILSFEFYMDGITSKDNAFIGVEIQFIDSEETSSSQKFEIENTEANQQWGRYIIELENISPSSTTHIYIHFIKQKSNGTLKYRHPKLEVSDNVTDYCVATEDLLNSINKVQENVDKNYEQSVADLKILQDRIDSIVVTDENGSQVIQTADGVRWNLTQFSNSVNDALDSASKANESADEAKNASDKLKEQVDDIGQKTAYMEIVQQDDGSPCLELGSTESNFKVRLTNTSLDFYEDTLKVAYINNQSLYIETAVIKESLQFGETTGFTWKLRENGNFGLQPFSY